MLNYNRALSDEKSYQDLQIKEVQPTIKLIIPMENKSINVTVADPVFLDKENKRLNAKL